MDDKIVDEPTVEEKTTDEQIVGEPMEELPKEESKPEELGDNQKVADGEPLMDTQGDAQMEETSADPS